MVLVFAAFHSIKGLLESSALWSIASSTTVLNSNVELISSSYDFHNS
eukprot:UN19781